MLENISSIVEIIVKSETPAEMAVSAGARNEAQTAEKPINTSKSNDNTSSESRQGFITQYLAQGRGNAVHAGELMKSAGLRSHREVRACVEEARSHGDLIVSSPDGYHLPETDNTGQLTGAGYRDLKAFYGRMRSAGISCFRSAKHARIAIMQYELAHNIVARRKDRQ